MSTSLPPAPPAPAAREAATRPPAGPGVGAVRIVGGLVAAAVVAVSALAAVATFTEQRRSETTTYRQAVTRVVLDTDAGSVELRAGAASSPVVVERDARWSLGGAPRTSATVAGGVLTLGSGCSGAWPCSVDYTLSVPPGTALAVTTSTGSVEAAGLDGELDVSTSTGSVQLAELRSARVRAKASTGSVELGFVAAPTTVSATTSTGSVEVVVPADGTAYDVHASTSVGSTEVLVPVNSSSPRRIDAQTSTGSVEVRSAS